MIKTDMWCLAYDAKSGNVKKLSSDTVSLILYDSVAPVHKAQRRMLLTNG